MALTTEERAVLELANDNLTDLQTRIMELEETLDQIRVTIAKLLLDDEDEHHGGHN